MLTGLWSVLSSLWPPLTTTTISENLTINENIVNNKIAQFVFKVAQYQNVNNK